MPSKNLCRTSVFLVTFVLILGRLKWAKCQFPNDYFTLHKNPVLDLVYPWTTFSAEKTFSKLQIEGSGNGEKFSSYFSLRAKETVDLTDVSISLQSDVENVSNGEKIGENTVFLKVVKVWAQSGTLWFKRTPVDIPELLINSDKIQLQGGWDSDPPAYLPGHHSTRNSLCIDEHYTLTTDPKNLNFSFSGSGAVEVWFKPNWDGKTNNVTRQLLYMASIGNGKYSKFELSTDERYHIFSGIWDDGDNWNNCYTNEDVIGKDEWVRITFSWNVDTNNLKLYLNGTKMCDKNVTNDVNAMDPVPSTFYIGGVFYGIDKPTTMDGCIEDLKFLDYQPSDLEVANEVYSNIAGEVVLESEDEIKKNGFEIIPNIYTPPEVPDFMNTDIPRNSTKQFFIRFFVDYNFSISEGTYNGNLVVTANEIQGEILIPIEIIADSFPLLPTNKIHMLYNHNYNDFIVDKELIEIKLQDQQRHEMNGWDFQCLGIESCEYSLQVLEKFPQYKTLVIVSASLTKELVDTLKQYNKDIHFYGIDECNYEEEMIDEVVKGQIIHQATGNVVTAVLYQNYLLFNDSNSFIYDLSYNSTHSLKEVGYQREIIDWPNYSTGYLMTDDWRANTQFFYYVQGLRNGTFKKNPWVRETYYWQTWTQKYKTIRLFAGIFLYYSKMDGFYIYHYTDKPNFVGHGDPFIDYDGDSSYRDLNIVHPKKGGYISTIQYEAVLDGIIDYRYLHSFRTFLFENSHYNETEFSQIRRWMDNELLQDFFIPHEVEEKSGIIFERVRSEIREKYEYLSAKYLDDTTLIGITDPDYRWVYWLVGIMLSLCGMCVLVLFGVAVVVVVLFVVGEKRKGVENEILELKE